jgi:hypothetical protein
VVGWQELFVALARAGLARGSLQLAWQFTTGSLEYTTGWLVAMRDDAQRRIPASGPAYEIRLVEDDVSDTCVSLSARWSLEGRQP